MLVRLAADALVVVHLSFIVFVLFGGLLARRWPWAVWVHVPAMAWGAYVEFAGRVCPLTPLEQSLRERAGQDSYAGGFVDHYLVPLIYPENITAQTGFALGVCVLLVNAVVYALVLRKWRRQGRWPYGARLR